MSTRNFHQMLKAQWAKGKFVCVGLDPDIKNIPLHLRTMERSRSAVFTEFLKEIVEATKDLVCAYKPNSAFFEAIGVGGEAALHHTISLIHDCAPGVPVILDAKRADIGNTNKGYVESAFVNLGADAITVHPLLGREALQPFLDQADKGIIVLCRTSNEGAGEFQDLRVIPGSMAKSEDVRFDLLHLEPLYKVIARHVAEKWNTNNNCMLVVGATYPRELEEVRAIVGDMPILIPGIGAQGGDLEATIKVGRDNQGTGFIINSSRGIISASKGVDFAEAARRETLKLHDAITNCLKTV